MKRLFVFLLLLPAFLPAQTPTASLSGIVVDSRGAVIANATVTARNTATGLPYTAFTDSRGEYLILNLPPAVYDVTAASPKLGTEVQRGVILQVDERARTDFSLAVGQVAETVQVSSQAALTDTESSAVGAVIDNRKVLELPLNARQFYSLALLAPGVYQPAQNSTLGYRGGFNVAGSKETWNNFTLNGVDDNDEAIDGPSYRPSVESIQEFKVLTGIYSAEYGRTSGGQVVVITKSGGNQFHGDLFEFLRSSKTDAQNYFTPAGETPPFHRNQFGGTVGGPIQRDKTFFFGNYEGLRLAQQTVALSTVPTQAMQGGDFRSLLTLPTPIHVVNPYTGLDYTTPNVIDHGTAPGDLNTPGALIGQELAAYYPGPTFTTPSGQKPGNNYIFSQTGTEQLNEFAVRGDRTFSKSDSGYANYNFFNDPTFVPGNNQCGPYYVPGFGCKDGLTTQLAMISETHIVNPDFLNEIRLNFERFRQSGIQQDVTAAFPGLAGVFGSTLPNNTGLPNTAVSGFTTFGGATNMPQQRFDNTYQIFDAVSYTHGKHTLKLGADLRYADSIDETIYTGRGALTFTAPSAGPSSGYSFADLLIGIPTTTSRNPTAPTMRPYHHDVSFFGQDDWRYRPYLTFNLGLRWEYDSPIRDLANNLSGFDAATGTITWAGHNGAPDNLYKSDFNNFGPRLGFAWQPLHLSTTVVRGGFGIFYDVPVLLQGFVGVLDQYPVRNPQTFTATHSAVITLDNAFPASNAAGSRTAEGINPNFATPYVDEWSIGVQQAITKSAFFELTYLGSKGTKLPTELNINQAVLGSGSVNSRRPYQLPYAGLTFGNVTYLQTEGDSSYHSLQAKLQQNYSNGLSYLLAYTYGHSIDEGPGYEASSDSSKQLPQNSYAPHSERGTSDFDVRHRFIASPVYDFPFGPKRKYLNQGLTSQILGDWQISGIFTWQTGLPFTVYYGTDNSNTGENADRPNVTGNPNSGPRSVAEWFNTAAFSAAGAGNFGNEKRNTIEGPGYIDLDTALARSFPVHNNVSLDFRAEAFNLANHPSFYDPTGTFGSGTFGKISQAYNPRQLQFALKLLF
jgi:hypothetical protein